MQTTTPEEAEMDPERTDEQHQTAALPGAHQRPYPLQHVALALSTTIQEMRPVIAVNQLFTAFMRLVSSATPADFAPRWRRGVAEDILNLFLYHNNFCPTVVSELAIGLAGLEAVREIVELYNAEAECLFAEEDILDHCWSIVCANCLKPTSREDELIIIREDARYELIRQAREAAGMAVVMEMMLQAADERRLNGEFDWSDFN